MVLYTYLYNYVIVCVSECMGREMDLYVLLNLGVTGKPESQKISKQMLYVHS